MPYARLDDRYDDHRKIKRALRKEPAAVAMHAMAITYCNRHNTDGEVDADWIEERLALMPYRSTQRNRVLETLLELQLFERKDAETFIVHDFLDWNLSTEQRKRLAEQGRRGGRAGRGVSPPPPSQGSSQGSSESIGGGSSTPTPRHATPTPTTPSRRNSAEEKASEDDKKLCRLLGELARKRNPKFKVKSRDRWLTEMRRLREVDGNSPDEIERAIRWVFDESGGKDAEFWAGVIHSPANLREHFAQVWARMTRPPLKAVPSSGTTDIDEFMRQIHGAA